MSKDLAVRVVFVLFFREVGLFGSIQYFPERILIVRWYH